MSRLAGSPSGFLLVLGLFLVVPSGVRAAQSYDSCTGYIASIPATINSQGTWCLKQDLATAIGSGNAVTVSANNVTIDCNGFKLGGLAAGKTTQTYGIFGAGGVTNTTVRNCNIRGFLYGISLNTGSGYLIEDNRFDGNTYIDLFILGDGSTIRRNRLLDTGHGTVHDQAYGIYTHGTTDVLDNTISNVSATTGSNGDIYGIYVWLDDGSSVVGNRIRGLRPAGSGQGFGIYAFSPSPTRMTFSENQVIGDGATNTVGLTCTGSSDRARNNTFNGVTTAMSNCGDAGGNDVTP